MYPCTRLYGDGGRARQHQGARLQIFDTRRNYGQRFDIKVPEVKKQYLAEAEEQVEKITKQYRRGMLDDDERYNAIIKVWTDTNDKLTKALMDNLDDLNPIYMMANSGARGSVNQIRQLAGMRGLMANTSGKGGRDSNPRELP